MKIQRFLSVFAVAAAFELFAAVPEVSNVGMSQNSDGIVSVNYTLSNASAVITLDIQTNVTVNSAEKWVSIGGETVSRADGDVWKVVAAGTHKINWDAASNWADRKIPAKGIRAVVTAWALDNTPDYMAVDISAGAQKDTQKYYPAAEFVPGGVSSSVYKTSKILMRKILCKGVEWIAGSTASETDRTAAREATYSVTLMSNYYIGVYEVTQAQWAEVATNSAVTAYFKTEGAMRPMERVSFNEVRTTFSKDNGVTTVTEGSVKADPASVSFLGLLRLKTGIDFDLPSEAQWEFAARAGNGSGYWGNGTPIKNGDLKDVNLEKLGRHKNNNGYINDTNEPGEMCGVENGSAIVGTYDPNDWGLYDMHGNVWELCLDWYQPNVADAKDENGNIYGGRVNISSSNLWRCLSGNKPDPEGCRSRRGGSWSNPGKNARSAHRAPVPAASRDKTTGFRLCCRAGLK